MSQEDKVEKALSEEMGRVLANEEDSEPAPHSIEIEIMAARRQLWRNTFLQARNETKISLACGDKGNAEGFGKQMRDAMSHLVQLDTMFPEAKARMQELDLAAEAQRKAQLAQLAQKAEAK